MLFISLFFSRRQHTLIAAMFNKAPSNICKHFLKRPPRWQGGVSNLVEWLIFFWVFKMITNIHLQYVFLARQKLSPLFSTKFSVKKAVHAVILGSYRKVLVKYVHNQCKCFSTLLFNLASISQNLLKSCV
jgi:hypothetical protein